LDTTIIEEHRMTTIIGVQEEDACTLYADNQTTYGERPYFHRDLQKIIKRNGYLLAAAGGARATDVINFTWKPPAFKEEAGISEHEFVVTRVIPSLEQVLMLNGCEEQGDEFAMLIALRGRIFEIASDFSVLVHIDGRYGIGTGAPYALGALAYGVNPLMCLVVAMENDIYSGGEIQTERQEKP
jgi:ATP-dependent protease HslVU (ClpYQ) peptidase subunit